MLHCLVLSLFLAAPPPPEVQAVIAKMRRGLPATAQEQQLMRDWMLQNSRDIGAGRPANAPDSGFNPDHLTDYSTTPPDIQAIIDRAKNGQKPSDAEQAQLQGWGAKVDSHKDDIRSSLYEKEYLLQSIRPDGGGRAQVRDLENLYKGEVTIDVTQSATGSSGSDHSESGISGGATFPVFYTIDDRTALDGGFSLQYRADPASNIFGQFSLHANTKNGDTTTNSTIGYAAHGGSDSHALFNGELYFDHSLPRTFIRGSVLIPANANGSSTVTTKGDSSTTTISQDSPVPLLGWTQDDVKIGIPWKHGVVVTQQLAAASGLNNAIAPEVRASLETARFDLNVAEMQAGLRTGHAFTVRGTYSSLLSKDGGRIQSTVKFAFRFGLTPSKKLAMFPTDPQQYQKWVPIPQKDDNAKLTAAIERSTAGIDRNDDDSKPLVMQVQFTPAPGEIAPKKVMEFFLKKVSRHKGFCINFPLGGAEKDDLKFKADQPGLTVDANGQHATTTEPVSSASIIIEAHDTGAYGQFSASAEGIEAQYQTQAPFISIPKDDDANHIADGYEEATTVKGHSVSWDEEDVPSGMQNTGDGLGAYEEYRGAMTGTKQSPVFRRLDPTRKKLMVYMGPSSSADWIREGVTKFGEVTKLHVYVLEDDDWLDNEGHDRRSRWLNFNSRDDESPHARKTLVVRIEESGDSGLHAGPRDMAIAVYGYCPDKLDFVNFDRQFAVVETDYTVSEINGYPGLATALVELNNGTSEIGGRQHWGLTVQNIVKLCQSHREELEHRLVIFSMLHELGHALGGRHHNMDDFLGKEREIKSRHLGEPGEGNALAGAQARSWGTGQIDCPMRYWQFFNGTREKMLFAATDWNAGEKSPLFTPWVFCKEDWSHMRLHDDY